MGIRINAFALDCVGFEEWLDRSVGDAMFYIARHAVGDCVFFNAHDPQAQRRYVISPQREVLCVGGGQRDVLTEASAVAIPALAKSLKESLGTGDSYPFLFLFDSLAACPEILWVRLLSRGHRYGWVFSFLQAARESDLARVDLRDLEGLCARMLRGHHFLPPAYPLKSHKLAPAPGSLPVLPVDDSNAKMAVFSQTECVRWVELIELVMQRVSEFRRPAEWMHVADAAVDQQVRLMLRSLDAIQDYPMKDSRIVSFIS